MHTRYPLFPVAGIALSSSFFKFNPHLTLYRIRTTPQLRKQENVPQILFADPTIISAFASNLAEYRSASVGCS